jgi:hypothetical protein
VNFLPSRNLQGITISTNGLLWVGALGTLSVSVGQAVKLDVYASATTTGQTSFSVAVFPCYRPNATTSPTTQGTAVAAGDPGSVHTLAASAIFSFSSAGNYEFGICAGRASGNTATINIGYPGGTALLFNAP